jgi:NAD(P)H-nitrite reductase large subunit
MSTKLVIIGASDSSLDLINQLRDLKWSGSITLVDRLPYSYDGQDYFSLLMKHNRQKVIDLTDFAKAKNISFQLGEVERVQFNKKNVHLKTRETIAYDCLVIAAGARCRSLDIKGDFREGVHYLGQKDVVALRDTFKVAQDIVIGSETLAGLKLAFYLSFLGKDIKLLIKDTDFLGEYKGRVFNVLGQRNIDIYDNAAILEIIGEAYVKAVKTSIPKVFSSQAVFLDSGFVPNDKLIDFPAEPRGFFTEYPQVYCIGKMHNPPSLENKWFLNDGYSTSQVKALAGCLCGQEAVSEPVEVPEFEDRDEILTEVFKEDSVVTLV